MGLARRISFYDESDQQRQTTDTDQIPDVGDYFIKNLPFFPLIKHYLIEGGRQRSAFFLWLLIWVTKIVSALASILLGFSFLIFIKNVFFLDKGSEIFKILAEIVQNGTNSTRNGTVAGNATARLSNAIFPDTEADQSYQILFALYESGLTTAPTVYHFKRSILFKNPFVWFCITLLIAILRPIIDLVHDSLTHARESAQSTHTSRPDHSD
jgi:hypothetical protein